MNFIKVELDFLEQKNTVQYKQNLIIKIMDTLITSIVGIRAAQRELKKYPTERELRKAMEKIHSKAVISSCYNIIYFVIAIFSAGLIHWALM